MLQINKQNILGKPTDYISVYSPQLLFPIARHQARSTLNLENPTFNGADRWTAYELSWLNLKGKPQAAIGEFTFSCHSPNLIESKSFKLYLNSLNQTRFVDMEALKKTLERDLSEIAEGTVNVHLFSLESLSHFSPQKFEGICLDSIDVEISDFKYNPQLLITHHSLGKEKVFTDLFRSNCPVTSQPDWASVWIHYEGPQIDHEQLLCYLISFREHHGFHEECVERIYTDLMRFCQPKHLTVYARFTRRGGLDINPYRSNFETIPLENRLIRQ